MSHQVVRFRLDIPPSELNLYYQGAAKDVVTSTCDGRRVQFPAALLRPYVSRNGVQGVFLLEFDDNHKLVSFRKISP